MIKDCIKESRKGQMELYKLLLNPFMRVCMRYNLSREDADSMVNLAFVKVIQNLKSYKTDQPFMPWCKRILTNTIIDELRKTKKRNEVFINSDFSEEWMSSSVANNSVEEYLREQDIKDVMNTLPKKYLLVFNMFAVEGYGHEEISKILGISERSSRRFLKSARDILKEKLTEKKELSKVI